MTKRFPGIDEFTSFRIRKDIETRHPEANTLAGRFSLIHEVRATSSLDPIKLVEEAKGGEATASEQLAATAHRQARIQSGLERLGDYHQRMSPAQAEAFLSQMGFRRMPIASSRPASSHQAWLDPLTGIVLAGDFDPAMVCLHCYMQFSLNQPSMSEAEEARLNSWVSGLFGGSASTSWFNPARPHLNHSDLHYPRSYPEATADELAAWQADYNALPDWLAEERGKWVMVADGRLNAGLCSLMDTLDRRQVAYRIPWEVTHFGDHALADIFACGQNEVPDLAATLPAWALDVLGPAISGNGA